MASAVVGIMIAPRMTENSRLPPGKRSLANAYPAIVARTAAPTALTTA